MMGEVKSTGYLHPGYAASLAAYGRPMELPHCQGWILQRSIPGFPYRDAMGCYPLFACKDWRRLPSDLEAIEPELVSLALVTDPFGNYLPADLRQWFPEVARPFKQHFVVDLSQPLDAVVSPHHQRNVRIALQTVEVSLCPQPLKALEDWLALYANLIRVRNIQGMAAFSRPAFARQLALPGTVLFRADQGGSPLGMLIWYVQGQVAYYHLGAYSDAGYRQRASFGLFWQSLRYLAGQGLSWASLGAGAGISGDGSDGLSRFKRGWATGTRTAFLCGRIFDEAAYAEIVKAKGVPTTGYFPAYRRGEFS